MLSGSVRYCELYGSVPYTYLLRMVTIGFDQLGTMKKGPHDDQPLCGGTPKDGASVFAPGSPPQHDVVLS